jgi:hypothetical protein
MPDDGGALRQLASSVLIPLRRIWDNAARVKFGGPEIGARFALLIFGLAAITAARTISFVGAVSDRRIPPIAPLVWIFHLADTMFLPGGNRVPTLNMVQQLQFVAIVVALAFFFLAARSTIPQILKQWHRPLARFAVGLAALLCVLNLQGIMPFPVALGSQHYGNDAIVVTSCATDVFLQNQNPYPQFDVIQCLHKNNQPAFKTTPLQAGAFKHIPVYPSRTQLEQQYFKAWLNQWKHPAEFESNYSYPSVSFLIPAIFVALHLHDLSILYLFCYLALAGIVIWRAPTRTARRMAAFAVCANAALWPTIVSGATDGLYSLLVLISWTTRKNRWASALAMGLAVAARQQAWFFLLFYAVLIWRTEGRRELWWRIGIVAGLFAVTNLPYFLAAPGPWLAGVLGPIRDPMFARGTGIISLSTGGFGALPIGPRWLYSVLEFAGLAASVAYYWRICKKHPGTGLILAPIALLLAWRSLYSYFLPISLLALYPALVDYTRPEEADPVPARSGDISASEAAA